MKRFSRALSWLLCMAMVVAMIPAVVSAAGEATDEVQPTPLNNLNVFGGATKDNGTYTCVAVNGSTGGQGAYGMNITEVDHTKDILLSQTLCIRDMPHAQNNNVNITNYGLLPMNAYTTYISDTKDASANGTGSGVAFSVFFEDENSLSLRIQDDDIAAFNNTNPAPTPIRLGKNRNDTFTLSVLWTTDNTVVVYVNGVEVGRQANCEMKKGQLAPNNAVYLGARTSGNNADAYTFDYTVSNVQVSNSRPVVEEAPITVQSTPLSGLQVFGGASNANGTYTCVAVNGSAGGQGAYGRNITEVDHSKDILLSQTLCIRDMPHMQNNNANITNYGLLPINVYTTYISDTKDASANGTGSGIAFSVFFEDENSLSLRIQDDDIAAFNNTNTAPTPIRLGKNRNDTFTLSVLWTTDNTVVVYVDGAEVGRQANCEMKKGQLAPDKAVYLGARTSGTGNEAYTFDYTVSNVQVSNCNPEVAAFNGTNVKLNSILGVRFYTPVENGTVTVAVGDEPAQTVAAPYLVDVFAQDMMKPITAKLYTPEGQLLSAKTFNLAEYIEAVNASADEKTKALATATLTYCQYAAQYKGNLVGTPNTLAAIPADAFANYAYPAETYGCKASAYLEEACQLRLYVPAGGNYTVNGEATNNFYSTELILAQDYDKAFTFTVKNGDEAPVEVTLTVLAYLNKCLNGGVNLTENQRNLMTAMYHYYAAADAYLAG